MLDASPNPPCGNPHRRHSCTRSLPESAEQAAGPPRGLPARASAWLGRLILRNRLTVALLSLAWLVWRSGTQPRRLAYPCQQAALGNLGIFSFLLAPTAVVHAHGQHRRRHRRRGAVLAGVSFLLAAGGIAIYLKTDSGAGSPPQLQSNTQGTGVPATVGIAKDADGTYTDAELERLVRRAVNLAGGLAPVMVDKRGGGAAPYNTPDGDVDVIILPNMSGLQPGLNTDPRVTRTVVKLAWEAGASAVKLGGAATGDNWAAFHDQGYDTNSDHLLDQDTRVALIDLNDTGTTGACPAETHYDNVTLVSLPTSGVGAAVGRSSYYVHNELLKTDVMIVVPSFKNHNLGTVTLGMKMRIGTAPQDIYYAPWLTCNDDPFLRWEMHNYPGSGYATKFPWNIGTPPASEPEAVQRSLVDLNLVRPHDFVVIDALVGCEAGPLNYDEPSSRIKSIMAARDTLAIDAIGALAMGYNADQIPCLTMANDTQKLGVKDRREIAVLGNHVSEVRVDFRLDHPTGYATPYRAEIVAPTLGGISLVEGQRIPRNAPYTVAWTGVSDNVHVIKAELTARPLPSSLLANGGFEEGSTGWNIYHSTWGGNSGSIDFNSSEAGRVGNSALHLYLNAGQTDSFAVYQEVPVTPGKAYRLNGYWKARYYGQNSWYEVMLIDGAWDPVQADTGGSVVLNNHMFAYDTNASARCPGGNPITADFPWTWTHNQYGQNVDNCWNDRDGVRVATGNTMTVVLKAGSCCGTNRADVWFDEVSLSEVLEEESLKARVLDPPDSFNMTWDVTSMPIGWYQVRASVYDAMMNEASITRTIEIIDADRPVFGVDPTSFSRTVWAGGTCGDGILNVVNVGVGTLDYTITPSENWLSVDPPTGQSTGYPPNSHTVSFNCQQLDPGDNLARLTLTAPDAYTVEVPVTVHVDTVRADLDVDGDVDQSDFSIMQLCFSGPGVIFAPGCEIANLDDDVDVDAADFNILHGCYSGSELAPSPTCMPN